MPIISDLVNVEKITKNIDAMQKNELHAQEALGPFTSGPILLIVFGEM